MVADTGLADARGLHDLSWLRRGAEQRYRAGLSNHLQLLSAETAVLAQRRLDVDLRTRALQAQVNLAQALGGGWRASTEQP